jgi:predicted nucleic acid-binding protein
MKPLVIDASIAIKWFIPEAGSDAAIELISKKHQLLAPDLIRAEVGNIVWKLHRRKFIETEDVYHIVNDFLVMPIDIHDSESLISNAVEIAVATGTTVYDSLYLALAVEKGTVMVTADAKLAKALKDTVWESFVQLMA